MMARCTLPRLVLLGFLAGGPGVSFAQLPLAPSAEKKPLSTNSVPPLPPPLDFRQLLAMPTAQQEKLLAAKSPQHRQILEAKMRESEALKPEEREARLRALQVRLHLRQLIKLAPSNRVARLAAIDEPERKLVEERLEQWDQLPKAEQKQFLENQWAISFACSPPMPVSSRSSAGPGVPPGQPELESELERWNALPRDQRIWEHFRQFCDLNEKQRARVLNTLSPAERQQIEKTLLDLEKLPKAQRDRCIAGFEKFADLSPAERQRFLRNAEKWQSISEKDRVLSRVLLSKFSPFPPLPPPRNSSPGAPPLPVATSQQTNN